MAPKRKVGNATKTKAAKKVKEASPVMDTDETNGNGNPTEEDNVEIESKKGAIVEKAEPAKKKATRGNKAKQEEEEEADLESEVKEPPKNKKKAAKPKKIAKEEDTEQAETEEADAESEDVKPKKRAAAKNKKNKDENGHAETEEVGTESEEAVAAEPEEAVKGRKRAAPKSKKNKEEDQKKPKGAEEDISEDNGEPVIEKKKTRGKKPKVEAEKQEEVDEAEEEEKPKGRGRKKAQEKPKKEEETEVVEEKKTAKGKKKAVAKVAKKAVDPTSSKETLEKTKSAPKNSTITPWEEIDFTTIRESAKPTLKITSWNVDGIRAWLKKNGMALLDHEQPQILCLQETKCSDDKLPEELKKIKGYHTFWASSKKDGYAGVGLITKILPIEIKYGIGDAEHDEDGRCITAEFEKFYLINVYVPNAGRKLVTLPKRLDWNEAFKNYVKELDQKKPVIICGDMNVAHDEIDLANPKTNTRNAGFTKEEREGMTEFLKEGFVDTFRNLYPDQTGAYTFWTYMANSRSKNVGWRLDYFITSKRIVSNICDNVIRKQVLGSDHCPITLFLNI